MMIPAQTTLKYWAESLVIDFPNDNIPYLEDEKDWKDWGNSLALEDSFARNDIPPTNNFNHWKSWAERVYDKMSNVA